MRALLLAASRNPLLNRFMSAHGLRLGASRFVAGEALDDFVPTARALNAAGFSVASSILGEGILDADRTRDVVGAYLTLLQRIAVEGLRANVALKLTHLGLAIDESLAAANLQTIVEEAERCGNFIRVDMEESAYVDSTLRIYRDMRERGKANLGIVLQAYLYRTSADLSALLKLRPNLRLVKGAYLEPPGVAFPRKADVDANYRALIETALGGEGFTAIATHDEDAIRHAIATTCHRRFEFQMLYGVRPALQSRLVAEGYPVRIAAPFGPAWYPYFMRRLAERPENVAFMVRSMLKG